MSLLSICQNVAKEVGFEVPSTISGNTDATASQLFRLANKEGEILSKRHKWNELVKESSITLVTSDQDYVLASDFRYLIPSTTWNRTDKRMVINPLTSQEWQYYKGWTTINGLNLRARLRNGQLEFEQTISSGENGKTIYYEYLSKYWAQTSGGTDQQYFVSDTDIANLDEDLITMGVVWRFEKAKGLDWQEDFAEYDREVRRAMARDKGSRTLSMGGEFYGQLGVTVPDRDFG